MKNIIFTLCISIVCFNQVSANSAPAVMFGHEWNISSKSNLSWDVIVQEETLEMDFSTGSEYTFKQDFSEADVMSGKVASINKVLNSLELSDFTIDCGVGEVGCSDWTSYYDGKNNILNYRNLNITSANGLVRLTVTYKLKNSTNNPIPSEYVSFSPFSKEVQINGWQFGSLESWNAYILYWEGNNGNIDLKINNEPVSIERSFIKQKLSDFCLKEDKSNVCIKTWSTVSLIKPAYNFPLSFEPNEEKTIVINYIVSLSPWFYLTPAINYDFSPIFLWKNSTLETLNLKVLINTNEYIITKDSGFYSDWKVYGWVTNTNLSDSIITEENWKRIYSFTFHNLSSPNYDNLKIFLGSEEEVFSVSLSRLTIFLRRHTGRQDSELLTEQVAELMFWRNTLHSMKGI